MFLNKTITVAALIYLSIKFISIENKVIQWSVKLHIISLV